MNNQEMMELSTVDKSDFEELVKECTASGIIDQNLYTEYDVKRGLRDSNGNGVLTGLTEISDVLGNQSVHGRKIPVDGELYFQGYNVEEIIKRSSLDRFRFEEATYLLLFGVLPDKDQLDRFIRILTDLQELSGAFIRDVIMKATSTNLMNSLMKSILSLYSYDEKPDDISIPNVLRQSLQLIAKMPLLSVYAYQSYRHFKLDGTLMIKNPKKGYSTAENILYMLRDDGDFTELEAKVLDICLVLHAGLIYGMGHAVYTNSDPRAVILKKFAKQLSEEKGMQKEFALYELVESEAGQLIMNKRKMFKPVCANVDFYSGFVYTMLGIPEEMFTPMFATSRISGWCAHRLEELVNAGKIIRPAYKYVGHHRPYVDMDER